MFDISLGFGNDHSMQEIFQSGNQVSHILQGSEQHQQEKGEDIKVANVAYYGLNAYVEFESSMQCGICPTTCTKTSLPIAS